jgi:hypothetical protein
MQSRVTRNKAQTELLPRLRALVEQNGENAGVKLCGNWDIEVDMGWLRPYNQSNPCDIHGC